MGADASPRHQPGGAGALLNLYGELDVRDALPLINAPTLVVHPRDDRLVPPAMGRYLADQIPGARWLEVPGGDHFFFANDPAAIVPARVVAAAEAGEVLVSQTVKDLVVGSGIEFVDRGSAELDGVPGEWRLYAAPPELEALTLS